MSKLYAGNVVRALQVPRDADHEDRPREGKIGELGFVWLVDGPRAHVTFFDSGVWNVFEPADVGTAIEVVPDAGAWREEDGAYFQFLGEEAPNLLRGDEEVLFGTIDREHLGQLVYLAMLRPVFEQYGRELMVPEYVMRKYREQA